jgi:hypothetical protein
MVAGAISFVGATHMKRLLVLSLMASAMSSAFAAPYIVDAAANSTGGGVGLATISLNAGDTFTVTASTTDLWSLGANPRWCNADGLTGNTYATGTDESGEAAGTQIGANFGTYTQGNLSAAYGSLVGQIDNGDFFLIGTNFVGVAAASGTLKLYNFDSNFGDNRGEITANVEAVPEPATMAVLGLGLAAAARRRRK